MFFLSQGGFSSARIETANLIVNYVMKEDRKLQILNEIKQIERELYLKRSQLASADAMAPEAGVYEGSDPEERKKVFSQLIKEIERLSTGGNSVEEIKRQRQR